MKKLLLLLLFIPFVLKSQTFKYTMVTDLDTECKCKSSIVIKDSLVTVKYQGEKRQFIISRKDFVESKGLYILHVDDNDYGIKKLTVCKTIAIITYNDKNRREVQFLNID